MKKAIVFILALIMLVSVSGVAFASVPDSPPQGTYTIGYWKTHPSAMVNLLPINLGTSSGALTKHVTSSAIAVSYLKMTGGASNGIVKLYAQLLAAKLNIENGASDDAVYSTIKAADAFLATHDAASWASLSKADQSKVLAWMTTCDNYNNGLIGPGHAG